MKYLALFHRLSAIWHFVWQTRIHGTSTYIEYPPYGLTKADITFVPSRNAV